MKLDLDYLKITRDNLIKITNHYSLEELNHTPKGFNNNLIWNLGHVLVTHQRLTYGLSGLQAKISNELIEKYKIGTKPEGAVNQSEVDYIKSALVEMPQLFEEDYNNEIFQEFKTYSTSYGVTVNSIEEAVSFNNLHEAMHLGSVIAIQKFL